MASSRGPGRPAHDDILTPAEWRVAEAVRHGMNNAEIARRQGVSADAVKFHVANILQKLGFARRGDIRRWDGVNRSSALKGRTEQMTTPVELGAIGQIARTVKDIAAARRWYAEALGLKHLYSFGNLAFFDCDGLRLFLSEGDGGAQESIIYFKAADIHEAKAALEARGVEFINAPHMIHRYEDGTEEWMAFFKDNEGRPLAIMARAAAASAP
jgi:DNA-binding CsgD family transcriptional regulator/catechol 2,3-dioxygenase-like lactoylglutathione lyase family enzyme